MKSCEELHMMGAGEGVAAATAGAAAAGRRKMQEFNFPGESSAEVTEIPDGRKNGGAILPHLSACDVSCLCGVPGERHPGIQLSCTSSLARHPSKPGCPVSLHQLDEPIFRSWNAETHAHIVMVSKTGVKLLAALSCALLLSRDGCP